MDITIDDDRAYCLLRRYGCSGGVIMVRWLMEVLGLVPKRKEPRKLPDLEAYFQGTTIVVKEKKQ